MWSQGEVFRRRGVGCKMGDARLCLNADRFHQREMWKV